MGLLLLILAAILVIVGVVELLQGAILFGVILLIVGLALGVFAQRTPTRTHTH